MVPVPPANGNYGSLLTQVWVCWDVTQTPRCNIIIFQSSLTSAGVAWRAHLHKYIASNGSSAVDSSLHLWTYYIEVLHRLARVFGVGLLAGATSFYLFFLFFIAEWAARLCNL